jgi:hypothetical protein
MWSVTWLRVQLHVGVTSVGEVNTPRVTRELNIFLMSECGLETDSNRKLERVCGV